MKDKYRHVFTGEFVHRFPIFLVFFGMRFPPKKGEFAVQLFADMGRMTYVRVLNKNETVDHISADAVRALK